MAKQNEEMVKLKNRNKLLEAEAEQTQYDLKLVDWYIEVFEKGINSQDIMR